MGSSSTKLVSLWIEDSNFTSWSGNTVCPRVQRVLRKLRFGNFYRANGAIYCSRSASRSLTIFSNRDGSPWEPVIDERYIMPDKDIILNGAEPVQALAAQLC